MIECRVKELLDYCYNDFVKIIGRVTEYDGTVQDVPYKLLNRRIVGISVTAEREYVKLVIKI